MAAWKTYRAVLDILILADVEEDLPDDEGAKEIVMGSLGDMAGVVEDNTLGGGSCKMSLQSIKSLHEPPPPEHPVVYNPMDLAQR